LTDAHHGRQALSSVGNASGGAVFVIKLPQPETALTQERP
jgi:hypothetical protein